MTTAVTRENQAVVVAAVRDCKTRQSAANTGNFSPSERHVHRRHRVRMVRTDRRSYEMTKHFTNGAAALLVSISAASLVATPSQAQTAKSPYENPALVDAIMFHQLDTLTSKDQEGQNRLALSVVGFSVWFHSRCNFLPQNIETAILTVYDQARQDSTIAEASRSPDQKLRVEAVWSGLRDAKVFLGENGCTQADAKRAAASLKLTLEKAMQEAASKATAKPQAAVQAAPGQ
jgi:hypothetical protein